MRLPGKLVYRLGRPRTWGLGLDPRLRQPTLGHRPRRHQDKFLCFLSFQNGCKKRSSRNQTLAAGYGSPDWPKAVMGKYRNVIRGKLIAHIDMFSASLKVNSKDNWTIVAVRNLA